MNRIRMSTYAVAAVLGLAGSLSVSSTADAQYPPPPVQVVVTPPPIPAPPVVVVEPPLIPEPPAVFIATSPPVYYEGHAAYWYRDRWVWRDGRGWHAYDREPEVLRERRLRGPARVYHPYERHDERREVRRDERREERRDDHRDARPAEHRDDHHRR